jgi:hypothetical protein
MAHPRGGSERGAMHNPPQHVCKLAADTKHGQIERVSGATWG